MTVSHTQTHSRRKRHLRGQSSRASIKYSSRKLHISTVSVSISAFLSSTIYWPHRRANTKLPKTGFVVGVTFAPRKLQIPQVVAMCAALQCFGFIVFSSEMNFTTCCYLLSMFVFTMPLSSFQYGSQCEFYINFSILYSIQWKSNSIDWCEFHFIQ